MMGTICPHSIWMILIFLIGYLFITIEHYSKINKATVALLMAIGCWALQFANPKCLSSENHANLEHSLADIGQVVFFLLGALTVVEIINQHKGFSLLARYVSFSSKRAMLWGISIVSFFLSSLLDNLTTTVILITLLNKLVEFRRDRLLLGGGVVIAANAGGAWTPIGDVTTTMLWIGGQLSTFNIVKSLFIPSLVCMVAANVCLSYWLNGKFPARKHPSSAEKEPFGILILALGVILLAMVPVLKATIGLPPFMGILLALGVLWLVTDLIHYNKNREHLMVPSVLLKIDLTTIFFFLGILLCIGALYTAGILTVLAEFFNKHVGHLPIIALLIGFGSAVVDNVPLVAATMGMYSLQTYPTDHDFWNMIAYCAGVGGSVLAIGSAAGVVFMGMEKVDFLWYVRRISLPATVGYLAGFAIYLLLR